MSIAVVRNLFLLLTAVTPIVFLTDFTRNPYYVQIVSLQVGMVVLWILVLFFRRGRLQHHVNPFEAPMLAFYAWAFLSWMLALLVTDHGYPIPQLIEQVRATSGFDFLRSAIYNEGLRRFLFVVTNVLLVYFFATDMVDRDSFPWVFAALFSAGAVASAYGVLQYFGTELIWDKDLNPFGGRCVSTFGNPNFLSSYVMMLFMPALAFLVNGRWRRTMTGLLLLFFCALLATLTRSSWFGLGVGVAVFLAFMRACNARAFAASWKRLTVLAAVMLAIFLVWPRSAMGRSTPGLYNPSPLQRLTEVRETADDTYAPSRQRMLIWMSGFDMVRERFFTGKGWGLFELFYPFYQGKYLFDRRLTHLRTHANNAHNEVVEVWSQTGTIGLGIYVLFLVAFFIYAVRLARDPITPGEDRLYVGALAGAVAAMIADNMLNVSIHFSMPAFLYFLCIGLLPVFDRSRRITPVNLTGLWALGATAVVSLLIVSRLLFNLQQEAAYFAGFKLVRLNDLLGAYRHLKDANAAQKRGIPNLEVNANYELANVCARMRRVDEAVRFYHETLAANCGYDETHFNLGLVEHQRGNDEGAWNNFSQALFINPASRDAYGYLGVVAMNRARFSGSPEDLENGVVVYTQGLRMFPGEKDFHNNRGFLLAQLGREEEAFGEYVAALRIDPGFAEARNNYESLKKKSGRHDPFVEGYDRLRSELAAAVRRGDLDTILQKAETMLLAYPGETTAMFYKANVLLSRGDAVEAERLYTRVLEQSPDHLDARYNYALSLMNLGKWVLARDQLERVVRIRPDYPYAAERLREIRERLEMDGSRR
jgi:tetratricopeptide (TPR) repeat protein